MNKKGFFKAIGEIKKQVKKQKQTVSKKQVKQLQLSGSEEEKIKNIGALQKTKIIHKQEEKWKHDKFQINEKKMIPYKKTWEIQFRDPQEYKTIIEIVKDHKAFISQINTQKLVLTYPQAYESCFQLLKKRGIQFKQKKQKQSEQKKNPIKQEEEDKQKNEIFNRII